MLQGLTHQQRLPRQLLRGAILQVSDLLQMQEGLALRAVEGGLVYCHGDCRHGPLVSRLCKGWSRKSARACAGNLEPYYEFELCLTAVAAASAACTAESSALAAAPFAPCSW